MTRQPGSRTGMSKRAHFLGLVLVVATCIGQVHAAAITTPNNGDVISNIVGAGESSSVFATNAQLTDQRIADFTAGSSYAGNHSLTLRDGLSEVSVPDVVIGHDGRVRVTNTKAYPWRAHVAITSNIGDCSGSLVAPDVVITAGHCVFENHQWATDLKVYPGLDAGSIPYGSCNAKTMYAPHGWTVKSSQSYDWAVIKLDCKIGNTVGYLGYSIQGSGTATIAGYPHDKKPLWSMWKASGTYTAHPFVMEYKIDTNKGESGAPLMKPGCGIYCAVAVHAYGDKSGNTGTRITAKNNFIQTINKIRKL